MRNKNKELKRLTGYSNEDEFVVGQKIKIVVILILGVIILICGMI